MTEFNYKEFNLGKKIIYFPIDKKKYAELRLLHTEDVKEFIRRVKEKIDNPSHEINCSVIVIDKIIDKLAGEKLI